MDAVYRANQRKALYKQLRYLGMSLAVFLLSLIISGYALKGSLFQFLLFIIVVVSGLMFGIGFVAIIDCYDGMNYIPQHKEGDLVIYNPHKPGTVTPTHEFSEFEEVNKKIPRHEVIKVGEKSYLLKDVASGDVVEVKFKNYSKIYTEDAWTAKGKKH